jgi:hypothetical protein
MNNFFRLGVISSSGTSGSPVPPPAPANFQAVGGDEVVHLSWDAALGADGYDLYRDGSFYIDLGNVTSYDDTAVDNETSYEYVLVAYNTYGDSPDSDLVSATPFWEITDISATAGIDYFDVSWSYDASPPPDSFDVELQPAGGDWSAITDSLNVATPPADDLGLSLLMSNTAYDIRVRAITVTNDGNWEEYLDRLTSPDSMSTFSVDVAGEDQIEVDYAYVTSPTTGLGIRIEVQLAGGDWSTLVWDELETTLSDDAYIISGLSASTNYDLRARAENAQTSGDWTTITGVSTSGGGDPGQAEITEFDFDGITGTTFNTAGAALYVRLFGPSDAEFYFWFNTGTESDPAVSGTAIEVGTATGLNPSSSSSDIAGYFAGVVQDYNTNGNWSASAAGSITTVTDQSNAARTDGTGGNAGVTVTVTQQGEDPT